MKVGETVLEAPQIFINVGGRPTVPPMPAKIETPVSVNESALSAPAV